MLGILIGFFGVVVGNRLIDVALGSVWLVGVVVIVNAVVFDGLLRIGFTVCLIPIYTQQYERSLEVIAVGDELTHLLDQQQPGERGERRLQRFAFLKYPPTSISGRRFW